MGPLHVTRAGVVGTVAVLIVAGACLRLGFWQLDRRQQRLARNAVVAERMSADRIVLETAPDDTAGLAFRAAEATGRLDNDRALVLAGRSLGGAPGVHLLTPLRLGDGAILVNRGWLPSADAATVDLAPLVLEGELRVEGVLLAFPDAPETGEAPSGFRRTWFRFDGAAMRAQFPYRVAPVVLQATAPPAGGEDAARDLPVILPAPSLDPGPHLSYAVQWFSFATIFLVGWAVLVAKRGGGAAPSD